MGENKVILQKLDDYPQGFPLLSRFHDSDDSFVIYRPFGTLFTRLLLKKQDELSRMEMLLMKMDKTDDDTKYLVSHVDDARRESIPEGWGQSRMELFEKMEKTALEYAKLLLQTQQLRALDRPSNRDFESVKDFVTDDGGTLSDEIYVKEDLVTLAPKRDYPCVERMPRRAALEYDALDWFFQSTEKMALHQNPALRYHDDDRIRTWAKLLNTFMGLSLIVGPVYLLNRSHLPHIGGLSGLTLIACAALSIFTNAKSHEIVALSLGYFVVLVVLVVLLGSR